MKEVDNIIWGAIRTSRFQVNNYIEDQVKLIVFARVYNRLYGNPMINSVDKLLILHMKHQYK